MPTNTGAGPVRLLGITSSRLIFGVPGGPNDTVTSLSVALPPRAFGSTRSHLEIDLVGARRHGAVHVMLEESLQFGPAFFLPRLLRRDAGAVEHDQRIGKVGTGRQACRPADNRPGPSTWLPPQKG